MKYLCCLVGLSANVVTVLSQTRFFERQCDTTYTLQNLTEYISSGAYFYFDDVKFGSLYLGHVSCKILIDLEQDIKWLVIDVDVAKQHFLCLQEEKASPSRSPFIIGLTIEQLNEATRCAKLSVEQPSRALMQSVAINAASLFDNGEPRHNDRQSEFNDLDRWRGLSRRHSCAF